MEVRDLCFYVLDMFVILSIFHRRYQNYHLFSFVPVQERLSGRMLDTAYLGAAGLWIPVRTQTWHMSVQPQNHTCVADS
jgi:hypothetical protein